MKKVIDHVTYNTETAEKIGDYWNGKGCNDFGYLCITLYRTRKGKFFHHCEGGAMTQYASKFGNMYGFGEAIKPLSDGDALEWASKYLDGDEVEKTFGISEEIPENVVPVTILVPTDVMNALKLDAKKNGSSINDAINRVLKNHCER